MMLPDVLEPGLQVVICGTAVSKKSASVECYYANPNNKFWEVLAEVKLTPYRLSPKDYPTLPKYGIGLTDLCKRRAGNDSDLSSSDYDVKDFIERIRSSAPKIVAFNGKKAAKKFYNTRYVNYGLQADVPALGATKVFILPSTSWNALQYWDSAYWINLAKLLSK